MRTLSVALRGSEHVVSFGDSVRLMFMQSALILFVPTIFLGATFPLATALCARGLAGLGHTIGRVYAVNTLGAILGSLAAAFVLIPRLGMQSTLALLMLVDGVSAAALAAAVTRGRGPRIAATVAIAVTIGVAVAVLPPDLFIRTFVQPPQEVIYYREGATDTVGVVETYDQRHIQYEDLRGTAGTISFRMNYYFGHFPMLIHPGTPRRVLHICFGVGNSLSAIVRHEELERVDNVELSPHVVEAAGFFWTNDDVINHPKVRTIIDDGRNYLMATREVYDVITIDYQRLAAKMRRPAIARDLELIGLRDVDHLLALLIFDEAAVADFVRGVAPVTDDQTVLDFAIPRSLGSGFGLGTWNTKAVANARNPWNEAFEREKYYRDHRSSARTAAPKSRRGDPGGHRRAHHGAVDDQVPPGRREALGMATLTHAGRATTRA